MGKAGIPEYVGMYTFRNERKKKEKAIQHLQEMVGVWEFVCSGYGFDPEHMQQYVAAKAFLDEQNKENRHD